MPRKRNLSRMNLRLRWRRWLESPERWVAIDRYSNIEPYVYDPNGTRGFLEKLRREVTNPDDVDHVHFCIDCWVPSINATQIPNASPVAGTNLAVVCADCHVNWVNCHGCDVPQRSVNSVLIEGDLLPYCHTCLNSTFSYCGTCRIHYPVGAPGHRHDGSDCCDSKAKEFVVGGLKNDTRLAVTLPAGVISEVGITEIRNHLINWGYTTYAVSEPVSSRDPVKYREIHSMACRIEEVGTEWHAKNGNYTKRLSRFAHKEFKLKIPPEVLTVVGNFARDHSTSIDFEIETTRELNMTADKFAHEGSCWWSSYFASRCTLKTNGGFGVRTFNKQGRIKGRAWVMPLKVVTGAVGIEHLEPTYNTEAEAYVVFNGYGDLSGYSGSRVLAHLTGMTYRKIKFECEPMYVNGDSAYLVGSEEIVSKYAKRLVLDVFQHSNLFESEQVAPEREMANA